MKRETKFEISNNLIIVKAQIQGPKRSAPATLVLDTGAAVTLLVPEMLDLIGYGPRDGGLITTISTAIGRERGYLLRVSQLSALGFTLPDLPIHVFDLADRYDYDGLLGLDFLLRFNWEVRSAERRILTEEIVTDSPG